MIYTAPTLVLVDASHLMYRSHNVFPSFKTTTGIPTGILFGCMRAIEMLKKRYPDAGVVFVFDGSPACRQQLAPTYKANREGDPAVHDLMGRDRLQKLILSAGCAIAYHPSYECDDLIANLCNDDRFSAEEIIIYSGDDDFCQLVSANPNKRVRVLKPGSGKVKERLMDTAAVFQEWGVSPESLALYRSLEGDASDEIKGLPRLPKKALSIAVYGRHTPEEFYRDSPCQGAFGYFSDEWKSRLTDFREQCEINFRLTKLPWSFISAPIVYSNFNGELLRHQFEELEFKSYLKKFDTISNILRGVTDGEQILSKSN